VADGVEKTARNGSRELIALLQDIERRSRPQAGDLQVQDQQHTLWEGILFSVVGTPVVASLKQIKEILNIPSSMTLVPGTRRWMLGIANVRGNLLPVIDLQLFLGGAPITIEKRSRVLVVGHRGGQSGLLVGGVQGLRHFSEEQRVTVPELPAALTPYVQQAFSLDGQVWPVFDMQSLAASPAFQAAAL